MEINIEKFICDCIEKAERSVTWEYIDENIDGHIFKGALREQGLEYKNGKIVKIGEEPKEAEERANEIYNGDTPITRLRIKDYCDGYHQAEKDNELTWEDIDIILKISPLVDEQHCDNNREFCEEVLKRFKERKEV